jgi:PiT family inorganic phosphate transporter
VPPPGVSRSGTPGGADLTISNRSTRARRARTTRGEPIHGPPSSHALIGGILGATVASAGIGAPQSGAVLEKVVLPLVVSPVVGFVLAILLMLVLMRAFFRSAPGRVSTRFGRLQVVSSAWMAFSHGGNDAQKTMGIITLALVSYYQLPTFEVPIWVVLVAATAMGLGTAAGGWRIIRTMGTRLADLKPIHGFAAETSAGAVIEVASRMGFPLSTTHVISSSILGVGTAWRSSRVRWNVAGGIITAWVLTIPVCALLGFGSFLAVDAHVGS